MKRQMRHVALPILVLLLFCASSAQPALAQGSTDLSVTIVADRDKVKPGQQVTYTVVATNLGPDAAPLVDVIHSLPDQLQVVSLTCDRGISPDGPFCEYESLAVGARVISTLVATPIADPGEHAKQVTTTAHVGLETTETVDPNASNNDASITVKLNGGQSHS